MEPEVAFDELAFRLAKGISIPIMKSAALVGCVADFIMAFGPFCQDFGLGQCVALAMAFGHHSTVETRIDGLPDHRIGPIHEVGGRKLCRDCHYPTGTREASWTLVHSNAAKSPCLPSTAKPPKNVVGGAVHSTPMEQQAKSRMSGSLARKEKMPQDNEEVSQPGTVYVLTNQAMPGLVKIGKTRKGDPQVRMDELYTTGVPVPFECEMATLVNDLNAVEQALHTAFGPQRINPKREFFEIEPEQVTALLSVVGGQDVTPVVKETNKTVSAVELSASEILRKRRPNMNFVEMNIPVGAVLNATQGDGEVTVKTARRVIFRAHEMSLTEATKRYLERDYNVAPGPYWLYQGRRLSEIYNEIYRG